MEVKEPEKEKDTGYMFALLILFIMGTNSLTMYFLSRWLLFYDHYKPLSGTFY